MADSSPLLLVMARRRSSRTELIFVPFSRVCLSRVPSSKLPTSTLPTRRVPTSTVPRRRVPTSTVPTSRVPTSCQFHDSLRSGNSLYTHPSHSSIALALSMHFPCTFPNILTPLDQFTSPNVLTVLTVICVVTLDTLPTLFQLSWDTLARLFRLLQASFDSCKTLLTLFRLSCDSVDEADADKKSFLSQDGARGGRVSPRGEMLGVDTGVGG